VNKTNITQLNEFGQSAWFDYISRSLINSGKLKELIGLGMRGMTSNPTIFDKAISSSNDYDEDIAKGLKENKSTFEIYDRLTVKDIQAAADLLMDIYRNTEALDGYISLEVSPKLAFNAEKTVEEAKRLHKKVNRPNLMIKVPSTKQGFQAIEELVGNGINVNATLIFSLEQYANAAESYIRGLKHLLENNGDLQKVRSVASIFVSRIDTACDKMLDISGNVSLKGKAAVANSALIYEKYLNIFSSAEFRKLEENGANLQRVLWASTSTKNPEYSDIKYVTELIAKNTVNTLPEKTFDAFLDHGTVKEALNGNGKAAQIIINELKKSGIDVNEICEKLLKDGVSAFEKSFESLLNSIDQKAKIVCA